jgi:hypothetical protein
LLIISPDFQDAKGILDLAKFSVYQFAFIIPDDRIFNNDRGFAFEVDHFGEGFDDLFFVFFYESGRSGDQTGYIRVAVQNVQVVQRGDAD